MHAWLWLANWLFCFPSLKEKNKVHKARGSNFITANVAQLQTVRKAGWIDLEIIVQRCLRTQDYSLTFIMVSGKK